MNGKHYETPEEKMGAALEEARKAYAEVETPVGAALFFGNELLCSDHNRAESLRDPTAHAEMLVLRHGAGLRGGFLAGCELYVTMEPCPMCTGAVLLARPDLLCYGCRDDRAGCCGGALPLPECLSLAPVRIRGFVREDECRELLQAFFRERREEKREG